MCSTISAVSFSDRLTSHGAIYFGWVGLRKMLSIPGVVDDNDDDDDVEYSGVSHPVSDCSSSTIFSLQPAIIS